MAAALGAQDCLYTLIEKGAGPPSAAVIGSIVGYVHAPPGHDGAVAGADRLAADVDRVADRHGGRLRRAVAEQVARRARRPSIASPLPWRCAASAARGPLTILSCDNLPGNGDAARRATLGAAARAGAELAEWVQEQLHVPELDGRPHHAGDRRRRSRVAARRPPASTIAGPSSPSRSASG